jgi:Spy/CpxP family protein refolding chaperone
MKRGRLDAGMNIPNGLFFLSNGSGPRSQTTRKKPVMIRFVMVILLASLLTIGSECAFASAQESSEKAPSAALAERLPLKIQKIQKELPDWLRKTGNKDAAGLMKTLHEQIKAKQFEDAEKTADSLLKMMGVTAPIAGANADRKSDKPASGSQEETVRRLTEKVERVKAGAQKWADSGHDPSEIFTIMQEKFQPLMQVGKIVEAEAVVDGVLKKLGMAVNAPAAATADEPSPEERVLVRIHKIQKELPAWVKETGRKEESDTLMKALKEQLADRNFAEAEKTADTILKMMGLTIAPALPSDRPANANNPKRSADPLAAFFPQQLVFLASDRIALKPEQRDALLTRVKTTQPRLEELKTALDRESAALASLISRERVEEAAVLAQLDKFLDLEREAKQLQARQGVAILNVLTSDQHAKLRELSRNPDAVGKLEEEFKNRITAKVERVTQGAEKWAQSGRDPSPIAEAMQEKVRPLMDAGRVFEAEVEIDRVLEQLKEDPK